MDVVDTSLMTVIATEEGVKSGLKGYMYTFPENMLDNGKYIEENKCFCREGKCLPAGLIDVTDCYYGFPIALSYPHYYKGEDVLFTKIEGLTPDKEKHETRFWIQPDSGLPLDVSAKIQINMALEDLSSITNAGRFSNIYLPMLWFDIRMYSLPTSMEERFKMYLNVLPVVEKVAMYSLFVMGTVLLLFTVYRLAFKIMFKSYDDAKQSNLGLNINLWMEKETDARKNDVKDDAEVYSPCEIPLNCSNESPDETTREENRLNFMKTHGERIMELSARLGENVKDRIRNELTNIKRVFKSHHENGDSLNSNHNNDSSDDSIASDGRFKYLEVVDDDDIVCTNAPRRKSLIDKLKRMNELDSTNQDLIVEFSD
ncbi:Scavenger receptor class B member 1 [Eumeta japonica]|uniref:Scavenger receptor class B member 1 n=1 Tax=Eumeta variegata TaxID=151549 RepID=A0A4C1X3T9_EUMVA|nr:Scavenger receptor class B member 1 [Eumeta japonica]